MSDGIHGAFDWESEPHKTVSRRGSFSEWPNEGHKELGLFSATTGAQYDFVTITVSRATYATEKFTNWVRDVIFTRLSLTGSISILIDG